MFRTLREIHAKREYLHPLRLESELSDLRVGYANPFRALRARSGFVRLAHQQNKKGTRCE